FTDPLFNLSSGDSVEPSIRTVDTDGNTLCRLDLPRYILSYPLDDLNITLSALVVECNNLEVEVLGTAGQPPYTYTYTDEPFNFDAESTTSWLPITPTLGEHT